MLVIYAKYKENRMEIVGVSNPLIDPIFPLMLKYLLQLFCNFLKSFNYDLFKEIIRFVLLFIKNEHTITSVFIINLST